MLTQFQEHLENLGYSPITAVGYTSDIKNCIQKGLTDLDLNFFNADDFLSIPISNATKRRWTSAIKKFAKFLKKDDPTRNVEIPRHHQKLPEVVEHKKIMQLIFNSDIETKTILLVLYSTGCRITSLCNLQIEHIKNDAIEFHTAKRNKPYISILTKDTKDALKKYLGKRKTGYVFCKRNGKKLTPQAIRLRIKRKMGKDYINPHKLRHSIATTLAENGTSIYTIQQFMNHASIATTSKYIHLSLQKQRSELNGKHPLY